MTMISNNSISHSLKDESPEAKVYWFRNLSISERMYTLCDLTDLALSVNPTLQDKRRAQSTKGSIRIISAT